LRMFLKRSRSVERDDSIATPSEPLQLETSRWAHCSTASSGHCWLPLHGIGCRPQLPRWLPGSPHRGLWPGSWQLLTTECRNCCAAIGAAASIACRCHLCCRCCKNLERCLFCHRLPDPNMLIADWMAVPPPASLAWNCRYRCRRCHPCSSCPRCHRLPAIPLLPIRLW